jgi:nicotinate-nucleotide adenylyltransferase
LKKISKKKNNKIGILGGTFDPPHMGHLYISKIALKKLKLDKILWVITKKNPLKSKPFLSKKKRIKLSKKITKNEKKIFVKDLESKIKSTNTFDLLNYINIKNPKEKIFFIVGADNLKKFHKWRHWKKIPELAKIVVFPRNKYSIKSFNLKVIKKLRKKDIIFIKAKKVNISSSLIRKFW